MEFVVKVDINQDAWNIWRACNQVSHGVDWKQRVESSVRENIVGKTKAEANKWLLPYLKQKYQEIGISSWAEQIQAELMPEYPKVVEIIEKITQKPLYRQDFTLFVTTINCSPYNFDKGYIWIVFKEEKNEIISTLLHELLHFQFINYYGDKVGQKLDEQRSQAIKEGMVVILNEYTHKWTGIQEETYSIYEEFAKELLKLWKGSANRNFKKFVDGSIRLVKKYNF